jgi:ATP-dependent DNA ligase
MLKLFDDIAKVGSPAAKIEMLKAYPYQEELKTVLRLATDPFLTFGITSTSGGSKGGDLFSVLESLARRELTGEAARLALGEATQDEDEREIAHRIIRKDLRCGIGEKLVLQAYPGLIRQFEVMRAKKFEGMSPRLRYTIEPKYDGLRCMAEVSNGRVTLLSRNGREFTSSDHLKPQLLELAQGDSYFFDGELISGNFNASSSAVRRKEQQNDSVSFFIFDVLTPEEWRQPVSPHYARRNKLEMLFQEREFSHLRPTPIYPVKDEQEAMTRYNQFRDLGYEGGMLKNTQGLYRFGKHKDWLKLKAVEDVDLPVLELIQGEGKYHGMLGAVIVSFKGKRVNVGSGFSDEQRKMFWECPELIKRKVIEIQYHEITPDGSLRHPRFIQIREDKTPR